MLLNTPAGIVDLRTGKLSPHRRDCFMTKITGVAPDASCSIASWLSFLDRVMAEDTSRIAFLQRFSGYSLTGSTREQTLLFAWGAGANGKTTFLKAITGCIGDYHRTAPMETFTDYSRSERHPTELGWFSRGSSGDNE